VSCQSGKRETHDTFRDLLMQLARDLEHSITEGCTQTIELCSVQADPESEEVHDDV
jgi:hypothetical protein